MRNDGKLLEDKVHEVLRVYQESRPSHFIRFYDQTSSGGRGHRNAGDFLWLLPKVPAVLIECKSSAVGTPLINMVKGSQVSRQQLNRHRLWLRAGHIGIYVYADLMTKEVTVFASSDLLLETDKRKPNPIQPLASGDLNSMESIFLNLARFWVGE